MPARSLWPYNVTFTRARNSRLGVFGGPLRSLTQWGALVSVLRVLDVWDLFAAFVRLIPVHPSEPIPEPSLRDFGLPPSPALLTLAYASPYLTP